MTALTCKIKEYIQPFERQLALQELRALTGGAVTPIDGDESTALTFEVRVKASVGTLCRDLAYWHSVGNGTDCLTQQIRGESTSLIARSQRDVMDQSERVRALVPAMLPKRRCLRYATHGLHEYRGKFFPQLVRALMNIARLPKDAVVLDPMCGSGTTLVEARLAGCQSWGLDMNPLSVFVTDVKCTSLEVRSTDLSTSLAQLIRHIKDPQFGQHRSRLTNSILERDLTYLQRWFAPNVLAELEQIDSAICALPSKMTRNFFRLCLSNILRGVSWQKDDDLRVRRDVTYVAPRQTFTKFLEEASRSVRTVATFLAERDEHHLGHHSVHEGDARTAATILDSLIGRVDAVITSPPYATALPYLDTDRLSLIYLGLLSREDHRERDNLMIGNREVTSRGRADRWAYFQANSWKLPQRTRDLINKIDRLNRTSDVGFRRKNLSALLASYFFDMRDVISQCFVLLRPGGTMFFVIGDNRTTAGGELVEIQTAEHLNEIATDLGFHSVEQTAMDMLISRDIFRKNAMPSERIVRLEKP